MRIKVIIHDGIVTEVLCDGQVSVEIVSIDKDYEDYEKLCKYVQELGEDQSLKIVDFTTANFLDEEC